MCLKLKMGKRYSCGTCNSLKIQTWFLTSTESADVILNAFFFFFFNKFTSSVRI